MQLVVAGCRFAPDLGRWQSGWVSIMRTFQTLLSIIFLLAIEDFFSGSVERSQSRLIWFRRVPSVVEDEPQMRCRTRALRPCYLIQPKNPDSQ